MKLNIISLQISSLLGVVSCFLSENSEHVNNVQHISVRTAKEKHQSHTFHLFFPGHTNIVEPTKRNDENISRRSLWLGHIPLFFAVENGYETIVNTLIEQNAIVNVKNFNGSTPLHIAAKNGFFFNYSIRF